MLLGDILLQATGKKADVLLEERILDKLDNVVCYEKIIKKIEKITK